MTQQNPLELKGNFASHPFAELLVEIGQARLSGSLRLSFKQQKTIVYFSRGEVIFGVSNSKSLRLFSVMLQQKKIGRDTLAAHPNFANDLEFSVSLQNSSSFSKEDVDAMIAAQVDAIVIDALTWPAGEWHFSPLARLRGDLRYDANVHQVLINYARCLPVNDIVNRFRSVNETFTIDPLKVQDQDLQAHEAYILARFQHGSLTIEQLREMNTLPEAGMLQALYVLWLGGILVRQEWNAALTPAKITEIKHAKIVRVKTAENLVQPNGNTPVIEEKTPEPEPKPLQKAAELKISLEEYLQRVEAARTHYDTLGLDNNADITQIKQMYFGLAKLFHPDRFHRESETKLRRIQSAFTELAHAYETLKTTDSRDAYNFKMRKEIEAREKATAAGQTDTATDMRTETALQSFEQGLLHLNDEEYDQASMLLGRAVHYSPENAQFHAYYGQALSFFDKQAHKAEAEFQAAVRLDPKNAKIRMMLVEFFVDMDMKKRAVGELRRFLEIAPDNRDAARRLEQLQNLP